MEHRRLGPADLESFFACRLRALQNAPSAFLTTYAEDVSKGSARFLQTLSDSGENAALFGAIHQTNVVGIVGVHRGDRAKTAHKASMTSMYVDPEHQRRGIAGKLVDLAIAHARDTMKVIVVQLSLEAENTAARSLYETKGFRVWGREPKAMCESGRFADELHMALMLEGSHLGVTFEPSSSR